MHLTYWGGTKAEVWSWWKGNSEKLLHQVLKGKTGTVTGKHSSLPWGQEQSALLVSHTGETHEIPTKFPRDRFHSELHSILWVAFFLISCSLYFKYPQEHSAQSCLFFQQKQNILYAYLVCMQTCSNAKIRGKNLYALQLCNKICKICRERKVSSHFTLDFKSILLNVGRYTKDDVPVQNSLK